MPLLVQLKTPEELSESGWIMTPDGYYKDKDNPYIIQDMYPILGNIVILKEPDTEAGYYIYSPSEFPDFLVTEDMIKRHLDFDDYPEYLI